MKNAHLLPRGPWLCEGDAYASLVRMIESLTPETVARMEAAMRSPPKGRPRDKRRRAPTRVKAALQQATPTAAESPVTPSTSSGQAAPPVAAPKPPEPAYVDPAAEFANRVEAAMSRGIGRSMAVAQVIERDPALHRAYVAQANNSTKTKAKPAIKSDAVREFESIVNGIVKAGRLNRNAATSQAARDHAELYQRAMSDMSRRRR